MTELKAGEPCPECSKIVRYPLSHMCDPKKVDCSVVNDVEDVIVILGTVKYRMPRRQFIDMVRAPRPEVGAIDLAIQKLYVAYYDCALNSRIRANISEAISDLNVAKHGTSAPSPQKTIEPNWGDMPPMNNGRT